MRKRIPPRGLVRPFRRRHGGLAHLPPASPAPRTAMLGVYALSAGALPLARRLALRLAADPWLPAAASPGEQPPVARACLFAPARFCPDGIRPVGNLKDTLARCYREFAAHAFLGATGIAVRCLAPLLVHKSQDPPVIVLDAAGRHVVSLLSGHWGGGNALARHVARLLGAEPVITTASDTAAAAGAGNTAPALDLLLRDAGLRPVDWKKLPPAQGLLLEGKCLKVWDPCGWLPEHPALRRLPTSGPGAAAPPLGRRGGDAMLLAAHWRALPPSPRVLRVAVPALWLGAGCRRGVEASLLWAALRALLDGLGLEKLALAGVATVEEKLREPALTALAARLGLPLRGFPAPALAACATPHPSAAAGRHFGLPPFSVCEAAALLAARQQGRMARLLIPKRTAHGQLTLALALAEPSPRA